ncbi:MAG: hypothetical protein JJLCMIEE_01067 [Acidimicrobiales bacterium]|nr:hypothetical protein [Acidimicrobiales bacterium]
MNLQRERRDDRPLCGAGRAKVGVVDRKGRNHDARVQLGDGDRRRSSVGHELVVVAVRYPFDEPLSTQRFATRTTWNGSATRPDVVEVGRQAPRGTTRPGRWPRHGFLPASPDRHQRSIGAGHQQATAGEPLVLQALEPPGTPCRLQCSRRQRRRQAERQRHRKWRTPEGGPITGEGVVPPLASGWSHPTGETHARWSHPTGGRHVMMRQRATRRSVTVLVVALVATLMFGVGTPSGAEPAALAAVTSKTVSGMVQCSHGRAVLGVRVVWSYGSRSGFTLGHVPRCLATKTVPCTANPSRWHQVPGPRSG